MLKQYSSVLHWKPGTQTQSSAQPGSRGKKPPRVRLDRGVGSYTSHFQSVCLADIFGVELIELRGSDGE